MIGESLVNLQRSIDFAFDAWCKMVLTRRVAQDEERLLKETYESLQALNETIDAASQESLAEVDAVELENGL